MAQKSMLPWAVGFGALLLFMGGVSRSQRQQQSQGGSTGGSLGRGDLSRGIAGRQRAVHLRRRA